MRMHQCPACGKELRDEAGVDVCRDESCGWRGEPDEETPRPDRYEPDREPKVQRRYGRWDVEEPPENATAESIEEAKREALAAIERAKDRALEGQKGRVRPPRLRAVSEESASSDVDAESPNGGLDG